MHVNQPQNFTAGIAGLLSLFPADKRPSSHLKDVVASAVRLDTPLGMTIALATVLSGGYLKGLPGRELTPGADLRMIGPSAPGWDRVDGQEEQDLEDLMLEDTYACKPTVLFL